MPVKKTIDKAKNDLKQGKSPTTAAGEFVHEEIEHIRQGKHGARSTKQAIAIGLSKARRAGVPLEPPAKGEVSEGTRRSATRAYEVGQGERKPAAKSSKRRRAATRALKREPSAVASKRALSRQAKAAAPRRAGSKKARKARNGRASKVPVSRATSATRRSQAAAGTRRTASARSANP